VTALRVVIFGVGDVARVAARYLAIGDIVAFSVHESACRGSATLHDLRRVRAARGTPSPRQLRDLVATGSGRVSQTIRAVVEPGDRVLSKYHAEVALARLDVRGQLGTLQPQNTNVVTRARAGALRAASH
jgi:hypothetical protein